MADTARPTVTIIWDHELRNAMKALHHAVHDQSDESWSDALKALIAALYIEDIDSLEGDSITIMAAKHPTPSASREGE